MTSESLLAVAGAPLVVVLALACIREPMRVGLPLYAAVIPLGGSLGLGASRFSSASSLMGVLLGLGLVTHLLASRHWVRRLSPTVPVWLLFLAMAAATAIWTMHPATTGRDLVAFASVVAIFVLASLRPVDRPTVRLTETALIFGGIASVALGLYQLLVLGGFPATPDGVVTPGTRFGEALLGPNIQAITLLVPMAISLNRAFNPLDPGRRTVNLVAAGLLVTGILMTGSRTGSLGIVLVLLTMLWASPRSARKGLLVSLGSMFAAGAYVWLAHPFGLAERAYESPTSTSGRTDVWLVGLAACRDYCAFGSGWGTYPYVYAETQASVPGARVLIGEGEYEAHNLWLLALVETGVLGVVLLTAGLLANLWLAWRLPVDFRPQALGGSVALTLGAFFLSTLGFKIFWLTFLLVVMYRNLADDEAAPVPVASTQQTSGAP